MRLSFMLVPLGLCISASLLAQGPRGRPFRLSRCPVADSILAGSPSAYLLTGYFDPQTDSSALYIGPPLGVLTREFLAGGFLVNVNFAGPRPSTFPYVQATPIGQRAGNEVASQDSTVPWSLTLMVARDTVWIPLEAVERSPQAEATLPSSRADVLPSVWFAPATMQALARTKKAYLHTPDGTFALSGDALRGFRGLYVALACPQALPRPR